MDRERQLENGLNDWRKRRLAVIRFEMREQAAVLQEAHENLKLSHEIRGTDQDVIEFSWEQAAAASGELDRLEREYEDLEELALPDLVLAWRKRAERTPAWAFLLC